ncbi:MAG TPA: hypothetical protein VMJ32_16200 [Pirellulales bacterium]|nr:hypothetical protein [Pirellulales bacterium]
MCWCLTLTAAAGISGCSWAPPAAPHGETLLKPVEMADDGVQLEIVSVRFPLHDDELNGSMWDQIDEQQIPLAVRRALGENGFRAGIVSGELPAPLAHILATADKKPASVTEAAARLEKASPVSRQQMQLHSGWRGEIIASNIYPEVPLLMSEDGCVSGHTYEQAQGILAAKTQALGDRRIRLHLTPELHYGEPKQQWVSEDGRILPQSGKPKRVFQRLAFEATLEANQMLLLTTLPDRPGTLGHYFFTEPQADADELQQKMLIIRLAQSRYDDLFPPATGASVKIGTPEEQVSQAK